MTYSSSASDAAAYIATEGPPQERRDRTATGGLGWIRLAPILAVHLCSTLSFSIALPFLVFLVEDLGGQPWTYGLLGATYSAAQMVGAPVLGRWSDRTGRRAVLLVSQAGTVLAWGLFLVALQLPREPLGQVAGATLSLPLVLLFLARVVDGLTGGNVSVANAYVADLTREDKPARQVAFGRMGMAASLGFTLGPALTGALGAFGDGYVGPVLAAIAISSLGAVLCLRLVEPSGRCPEGPPPATVSRMLGQEHRRCDRAPRPVGPGLLRDPRVRLFLVTTFVIFLAFNLFYGSFPVHATRGLGWSTVEMGLFYSVLSAAMFVVQGPVLQFATRRAPPRRVFGIGMGVLVLAFACLPVALDAAVFTGALLFALGNGLSWATFQARATQVAPEEEQGALQGAMASAGSLASILGLVVGGVLYPHLGGGQFLICAALFALVLLATPRLFPPKAAHGEGAQG